MSYTKAWEVGYARDRAHGRRRYVPATDTRARLQELVDAQVPIRAIARASGLSGTAVAHIMGGRHEQVQRQTAARIASLTLNDVYARASGSVPSVGAVRRVQALMALGWRKADLEAEGVPSGQLVTRSRDLISIQGWRQVRDVYDRLSMTLGPSQAARDRAAARGYPPPLAWDDETIDDPRATPQHGDPVQASLDSVVVDRLVAGVSAGTRCDTDLQLTQDERVAAVRGLSTAGYSDREIAEAIGVSPRTVLRLRHRQEISAGRPGTRPGSSEREELIPVDPTGSQRLRRSTGLEKVAGYGTVQPRGANVGLSARRLS
ncbi:hypothetical protein ASC58_12350 [Phycicoccus sp. Root101]|nr:hypothetical protein ASC58_12350 [Phycicoccus sp. Root101]